MYPARFYVTYPLVLIAGLAGTYALRTEVEPGLGAWIGAVVVGGVGFAAGWSIAWQAHDHGESEKRMRSTGPALAGALSIPAYFAAKAVIGPKAVLWFCALGFTLLAAGFFSGALVRRVTGG